MLKQIIKNLLHKILGFNNYLFLFSIYSIKKLRRNKYEVEFHYFLDKIPEDGIVLDIGANIGITTVALAKKATRGMVYSFEPMPDNVKALKRIINYYKLKNVKLFETALGDETGQIEMVLPIIQNTKMQGLSHVVEPGNESSWNKGKKCIVPIQKLDDLLRDEHLEKIDAIKIDVENYEYFVLRGAHELLTKYQPVIYCELWKNEKRDLTLNYLKSLGYTIKVYDDQSKKLVDYVDQDVVNFIIFK